VIGVSGSIMSRLGRTIAILVNVLSIYPRRSLITDELMLKLVDGEILDSLSGFLKAFLTSDLTYGENYMSLPIRVGYISLIVSRIVKMLMWLVMSLILSLTCFSKLLSLMAWARA